MGLGMFLVKALIRIMRGPKRSAELIEQKYKTRKPPRHAFPTSALQKDADLREMQCKNRLIFKLNPKTKSNNLHLIYLHGGGFVNPLVKAHWDICSSLIKATQATVYVPLYPLAPEHEHTTSLDWLIHAYETILSDMSHDTNHTIILCGDSAGGNLVLTLSMALKKRGIRLPNLCILFCPWIDLSMQNPMIKKIEKRDVMLKSDELLQCATWWANGLNLDHPLISPCYANDDDLKALPPIQMFLGSDDILCADARQFAQKLKSLQFEIEVHETSNAFHDFMGAPFLKEAKDVYQKIILKLKNYSV
jgi:monoterpene epsilon-lactone hydrolase